MAWLNLARELENQGLSMYEFAKRLDVPISTVSNYFQPGADPKFSTVLRWSKVLGVDIASLLDAKLNEKARVMPRLKSSAKHSYSSRVRRAIRKGREK